jgi:hypothetical protein
MIKYFLASAHAMDLGALLIQIAEPIAQYP